MAIGRTGRARVLRAAATLGAVLTAWVALDSVAGGGLASGAADDLSFLLLWPLPFAVTAAFLGWYALRGGRVDVAGAARHGCVGGALVGGGVFLLLLASPLLLPWDALSGAVAAFLYAPLASVVGLLIGVVTARMRKRRS
ncbi:MAG: hypothetical protein KJO06_09670 [Gemmatimonadetes bacterium]|nr:hypothetical protein [Gemmatimonadota bacterium]NNK49070.1 hypothetical protein [Gemmatimonadota bacterium]